MEQRSNEWFAAVCGSLGGHRVAKAVLDPLKSGPRKGLPPMEQEELVFEIAAEQLTGVNAKRVNALRWGEDHEDQARASYELRTNEEVIEIGMVPHPTIPHAHVSPDALVGSDGGLEIKCPTQGRHLRTLVEREVPEEHLPQVHWALACTGRAWWDFMSFDPRFPAELREIVIRVHRDEAIIADMEKRVREFLADVDFLLTERLKREEAA